MFMLIGPIVLNEGATQLETSGSGIATFFSFEYHFVHDI